MDKLLYNLKETSMQISELYANGANDHFAVFVCN